METKKTTLSTNPAIFKTREIDLICALRFNGFRPLGNPVEDLYGTRWVFFEETPALKKAVYSFLSGNREANLLNEFRRTRSFLLDTKPEKEKR